MNKIVVNKEEKSKRFRFNWNDGVKILKGTGIAAGGAGLTFLAQELSALDMGEYTPFVAAGCAILLNLFRKFVAGESK